MPSLASAQNQSSAQIPLIHEVHAEDRYLLNTLEGEWFEILSSFDWTSYQEVAAAYYDALYAFNLTEKEPPQSAQPRETQAQAQQRLLFERPTMSSKDAEAVSILYHTPSEVPASTVNPSTIVPGTVAQRLAGRKPKCFFSLLKSFLGATLMGFTNESESLHRLLKTNPSFARVCGFIPKPSDQAPSYHSDHIPSLRKLEQFDQVMRTAGLWDRIKHQELKSHFDLGVIEKENKLVGDTTHYLAYSAFHTLEYADEKGVEHKKSQSKLTKNCRCPKWDACPHDWVLSDPGAATVVKSRTKMYWAHKASILGFPEQGAILDVIAVADSATHDGKPFFPHVQSFFERYPQVGESVKQVLYDSACDDQSLKQQFQDQLGVELRASFNPRATKPIQTHLPRGIGQITPYGVPICGAGHELEYRGIRYQEQTFLYRAPVDEQEQSVCLNCPHRAQCCNSNNQSGRTIAVSFDTLPHINPSDPPMAKRFQALMRHRPSVERMIKRFKCDLGDGRLKQRGNESFQATLDKTLIRYHLLLRHLH